MCFVNTCAVVYENDNDFGDIDVIPLSTEVSNPISPSQMIDRASISHLAERATSRIVGSFVPVPRVFFGCAVVDGCNYTFDTFGSGFQTKTLTCLPGSGKT